MAVGLSYRHLSSDEFFVGKDETNGPGGFGPPEFKIHTFVADVGYAFNDQFRLRLAVPFSTAQVVIHWRNNTQYEQNASGIGDVSLDGRGVGAQARAPTNAGTSASVSASRPRRVATRSSPTGPSRIRRSSRGRGWGILLGSQAFHQITERSNAYATGFYMVSPKAESDVEAGGVPWSVPDVYSARLGATYDVQPDWGLSLSLGGRIDGIPVHDLVGGGDETTVKRAVPNSLRRPGPFGRARQGHIHVERAGSDVGEPRKRVSSSRVTPAW
jgi:hypothetical protein